MKEKKKNTNAQETQKRIFLRMKSPSAFGAAKRFDSASFMNVPPEMARRDAALLEFSRTFRSFNPVGKEKEERRQVYSRILALMNSVEEKSEFILNSDTIEKRHLENADSIAMVRLLKSYFVILCQLTAADDDLPPDDLPARELIGKVNPAMANFECLLTAAIRVLLDRLDTLFAAQKDQRRKQFSKSDSERYERAFAYFTEYYRDPDHV